MQTLVRMLFVYQLLEESLRIYLRAAYRIVMIRSAPAINFTAPSIDAKPLGALIEMFAAFSNNKPLIRYLRQRVEMRNYCAHEAFVNLFMDLPKKPKRVWTCGELQHELRLSMQVCERVTDNLERFKNVKRSADKPMPRDADAR